jgi:hypothetical protein
MLCGGYIPHIDYLQTLSHFRRHVPDILFVLCGEKYRLDTGSIGTDEFLLDPADSFDMAG